jgi:hypothetical protein
MINKKQWMSKLTNGLMISLLLISAYSILAAQPQGYSEVVVVENDITRLIGVLNMPDTNHILHGEVVKEYIFNESGDCIRERHVYPLVDVVTTSRERITEYDDNHRVVGVISISGRLALTKEDEQFIAMFGANKDTVATNKFYEGDRLVRREQFNVSGLDTLVRLFSYEDGLLAKVDQYSTKNRYTRDRKNYTLRYFYDSKGRTIREEKQYATTDMYSVKELEYRADSDQLVREKTFNEISWTTYRDRQGGEEHRLKQDSLRGRIIKYIHDRNNQLIRKEVYLDLADLSKFRVEEIDRSSPRLIRRTFSGDDDGAILLKDEEEAIYNSAGMLVQENIFLRGKLLYSYKYKIVY